MPFRLSRHARPAAPTPRRSIRRLAVALRALALGVAVATCVDGGPTGPAGRRVSVSLAPAFSLGSDDPVVAIARLVATVRQHPSLSVVFQTVVPVNAGDESVALTLTVPLVTPDDRYRITVDGVSADGDTVYRATVDSVNLSPQGVAGVPIQMPLRYAGPDTLVAQVSLAPRDTIIKVGDAFQLRGTASTAAGVALPGALLNYVSRDPARLAVTPAGAVTALEVVEEAWVVVATANSRSDSTRVTVRPRRTFTSIAAGPDRALSAIGDTAMLDARALDQDGGEMPEVVLGYSSTNEGVATVDADGVITARGVGTASIVVRSGDVADTVVVTVSQLPASVSISPAGGTLESLQQELALSAEVRDRNGSVAAGAPVTWRSADATIASVSAGGVVRSLANGDARIIAAAGDAADTVVVRVAQRAVTLAITPAGPLSTAVGDVMQLAAAVHDANGHALAGATIAWSSDAPGVASVDATGQVASLTAGLAHVTASAEGLSDVVEITVVQEPASIEIGADSVGLDALNVDTTLTAVVRDRLGAPIPGAVVAWSSGAPAVATVSAAGALRSVATGRAVVQARFGALADSVVVGVRQAPARVVALQDTVTLTAIADAATLSAQVLDRTGHAIPGLVVLWNSLSPAIVSVSAAGVATAGSAGTARIVARNSGLLDTVVVVVAQVPASVAISPTGGTLTALSELLPLSGVVRDRNGFTIASPAVEWRAGTNGVVEVSALGVVRALANGSTHVRALAGTARDSIPVTVSQEVASITLSRDTVRLANVGDTATVLVTPRDRNGFVTTNRAVSYATSNADVARVAAVTGGALVTLTGAGVATVTAVAGGMSRGFEVIKTPADVPIDARYAWIRVTPDAASPRVEDTLALVADMMDASGTPTRITPAWATSQPGRASVSSGGLVVANDTGAVTITATSNGVAGHARLQLLPAPVLRQFDFAPRALYGSATSPVRFSVSLEVRDAGAGVGGVQVTFTGPGGATQSCAAAAPTSGTRALGWWDCVITIPAGAPTGTWRVTRAELTGSIVRVHEEASLARFGGTTLTVNP